MEETLRQRLPSLAEEDELAKMEQAANDPLFMDDVRETMSAFVGADAQWWEPAQ